MATDPNTDSMLKAYNPLHVSGVNNNSIASIATYLTEHVSTASSGPYAPCSSCVYCSTKSTRCSFFQGPGLGSSSCYCGMHARARNR